jgi:hypothetical protein
MPSNKYTKYMSQVHEPGYDTVLGYMANNMPDQIDEMIDAVVDTIRINRLCIKMTVKQGYGRVIVTAPKVLQDAGIHTIEAFPIGVIQKVLSE